MSGDSSGFNGENPGPFASGLYAATRRWRLKHQNAVRATRLFFYERAPPFAAILLIASQQQNDWMVRRKIKRCAGAKSLKCERASCFHIEDARTINASTLFAPASLQQCSAWMNGVRVAYEQNCSSVTLRIVESFDAKVLAVVWTLNALDGSYTFNLLSRLDKQIHNSAAAF